MRKFLGTGFPPSFFVPKRQALSACDCSIALALQFVNYNLLFVRWKQVPPCAGSRRYGMMKKRKHTAARLCPRPGFTEEYAMRDGFYPLCGCQPGFAGGGLRLQRRTDRSPPCAGPLRTAYSCFCLPELCLTGYTCGDLFLQQPLLRGAEEGLRAVLAASEGLNLVTLAGLPVRAGGKLYNCAAVVCGGRLLGLVSKTHLPNYAEFYEMRHFAPGPRRPVPVTLAGQTALLGTDQLFACAQMPEFVLGVEICEDLWAPVPPSCAHAPGRGPPWWRTFRPATRRWARPSTAGRLWPGRARGCCAAISMPMPATAKAQPT